MKKINIKKLKNDIENITATEAKKTIIINNAELYNDLIDAYKKDKVSGNIYIIYQLNGMLVKQITELEKNINTDEPEEDTFQTIIAAIKNTKESTKPIGFAVNNKKDIEKRD